MKIGVERSRLGSIRFVFLKFRIRNKIQNIFKSAKRNASSLFGFKTGFLKVSLCNWGISGQRGGQRGVGGQRGGQRGRLLSE